MLAWLCLLFALPALAQPLQLQIQRDQMSLGETLGVVVSSDIGLDLNQLDLSPLQRDFEVLGRSSGTQISMVNGTTTRTSTLELQLRPLREGRLQLPALQLDGQQTQPAVVDVVPTPVSGDQLDPQQDFMILLEADSEQPYVQQQITLTVRLYYGVALSDGSLSEPSSDSAVVSRIGRDEIYASQVGGRNYQVLQRRYAVIPQQSGELRLGPLLLTGRAGRGGMFSRGQPVSFRSRELALQVRPAAAGFPSADWLPARELSLTEQLSVGPYRVGEPITRTLQLRAAGVSESILPPLPTTAPAGTQAYPDQPARGISQDGGRLLATLEQKLAIVPGQAGPLQLPAVRVPWWDVAKDQLAWAEIPAREIEVAAAAIAPATTPVAALTPANLPGSAPGGVLASGSLWPWTTALFAVLWLATLTLWWLQPRTQRAPTAPAAIDSYSLRKLRQEMQAACKRGDSAAAERAALALYRLRGGQAGSARELAAAVASPVLAEALQDLDRARYGPAGSAWDGSELWQREAQLQPPSSRAAITNESLPPLHPDLPRETSR
ncbi:MAG: protein BatD [Xanthomonadales bacterium]|nr:protein BatD [Xanthomonadales bacterium]